MLGLNLTSVGLVGSSARARCESSSFVSARSGRILLLVRWEVAKSAPVVHHGTSVSMSMSWGSTRRLLAAKLRMVWMMVGLNVSILRYVVLGFLWRVVSFVNVVVCRGLFVVESQWGFVGF